MAAKIIVETMEYLPCSLKTFTINDIPADNDDFGSTFTCGAAGDNSCGCRFIFKLPTQEVLDKYKISLDDYRKVCEALEDKLYVSRCGLCW